jgi:hypothetical protein
LPFLTATGHDVRDVFDIGLGSASDTAIPAAAGLTVG